MPKKIVFYCRCRPQDCDAIDIVKAEKRVFIGHPAWRKGKYLKGRRFQEKDFQKVLFDVSKHDPGKDEIDQAANITQIAVNRNLVRDVGTGSIVLVPRPSEGIVYAGYTRQFELVDEPTWGKAYLDLRKALLIEKELKLDQMGSHLADVVQGWPVDEWRKIQFMAIPVWIRKSLFGRSTVGRIKPVDIGDQELDPFDTLEKIFKANGEPPLRPKTNNVKEIEKRLLTDIGPSAFEHLVVALLQLVSPDEIWCHVGGSGDGGVDGMGSRQGKVVGLLQCKWKHDGKELKFENNKSDGPKPQLYIATMLSFEHIKPAEGTTLWDRKKIAELVRDHAEKLPWAISMELV